MSEQDFDPSAGPPRMSDVARLAGVSKMTVSRVLAGHSVALATRERVQQAIDELGYVADAAAGALSSGRSEFVAVLVPSLASSNFSDTVRGLSASLEPHGLHAAQILLTRVPNPTSFGVAELDAGGRVVGLEEKPKQPKSDLALVGVYLFTPAIHEAVRSIEPSWRGELEITHAIQWLIDQKRDVRSTTISGYWKDTGNVTDMLEVNRSVLETVEPVVEGTVDESSEIIGRVRVEAGASVSGSRIVGPAIIGAGTVVNDAYIGPFTSVSEDCRIEDSEIEYSIVLRGSSVTGVRRVEASLIGRDVEVTPAPRNPKAHRLVLGDHSKVQISS